MPNLYITRAQPNPRGRDTSVRGLTSNTKLNEEWIEFRAEQTRSLIGDDLFHTTFVNGCVSTGYEHLHTFGSVHVGQGQSVRVHTGSGTDGWVGGTYHVYLGRGWFVWNNRCGDRITLSYKGDIIDSAAYTQNPPEGELIRIAGTDRLSGQSRLGYSYL